jgi:N-acyl-D-aspartate/D-glutamate deacylase
MIGASDAGARSILHRRMQTDMIGTWVREKEALSLERAIARIPPNRPNFSGIRDRGRLVPGAAADLAIFNFDEVGTCPPEPANDLPDGERRMIMKARGMEYVVVNGACF